MSLVGDKALLWRNEIAAYSKWLKLIIIITVVTIKQLHQVATLAYINGSDPQVYNYATFGLDAIKQRHKFVPSTLLFTVGFNHSLRSTLPKSRPGTLCGWTHPLSLMHIHDPDWLRGVHYETSCDLSNISTGRWQASSVRASKYCRCPLSAVVLCLPCIHSVTVFQGGSDVFPSLNCRLLLGLVICWCHACVLLWGVSLFSVYAYICHGKRGPLLVMCVRVCVVYELDFTVHVHKKKKKKKEQKETNKNSLKNFLEGDATCSILIYLHEMINVLHKAFKALYLLL